MTTTVTHFEPAHPVHLVLTDPATTLRTHGTLFRAGELTEDESRRPVVRQSAGRSR